MSLQRADVKLAGKASATISDLRRQAGGTVPSDVISQLKRLPSVLAVSGLPATMAFLYSKADGDRALARAYRAILDALLTELQAEWDWDDKPDALEFFKRTADPNRVDSAALSRASIRLQNFALWLRRLAEALEHSQRADRKDSQGARRRCGARQLTWLTGNPGG